MTPYIGVTTFFRNDSGSPPYAGTTFSPVFKFIEPDKNPYKSYAIWDPKFLICHCGDKNWLNKLKRRKHFSHKSQKVKWVKFC